MNKIFFSRNNQQKGLTRADKKGRVWQKIYEADRGYFDWENVRELAFNSDEYTCMHPALSADENRLYFTSNMPGGYGGMDLYFVEKTNGEWSKPINLGPEINSSKNEVFPFIHESSTLFFASDGHKSMGGLDLFMIDIGSRKWGRLTNLRPPFNSQYDDFGLIIIPDGKTGYFSSNRVNENDDIYKFDAPEGIRGMELPQMLSFRINVQDSLSGKNLAGAGIYLFEKNEDGQVALQTLYEKEVVSADPDGLELIMKFSRKKELDLEEPLTRTSNAGTSILSLQEGKDFLLMITRPGYKKWEMDFSTFDKDFLEPLDVKLVPSNCLYVSGLVVTEKFKRRIPNANILIKGDCEDYEERIQANIFGEFEYCIPMGCDFVLTAEREGYEKGQSTVSTAKLRGRRTVEAEIRLKPKTEEILKRPIREGTVIVLDNIYYDFNKSAIRAGEDSDLETLAKLMRTYPSMEVELGAHTDCRGGEEYNLKLSLKRAESAKDFLMGQGVTEERIKVFGFGEAFPRNHCVDGVECSEDEHQFNRRTEVKVTKIDESLQFGYSRNGIRFYNNN